MSWLDPLTWPIHPWALLGVGIAAALYARGGTPRLLHNGPHDLAGVPWRAAAFFAGLAVIVVALDTPIETLAAQLFWVHMTQHLLLIAVAAPLLVAGAPGWRIWRGLPLGLRRPLARTAFTHPRLGPLRNIVGLLAGPAAAWLLSSASLWIWHWPAAYDLALRNHAVHHLEHAVFLATALLFWAQVIDQPPFRCRMSYLRRSAYVFGSGVQSWLLAAVLGFASLPYYSYAEFSVRPGSISALGDQQLGAGIMWVPGSIASSIVIIACVGLWLRDEARAADNFDRAALHTSEAPAPTRQIRRT